MDTTCTELLDAQKKFFVSGQTKSINFRKQSLSRLERALISHRDDILQAASIELHKSAFEALQGELIQALAEVRYAQKHIKRWTTPKRATSPSFFPFSRGYVTHEPHGVSLIFSPFNHPFSTSFSPLVSAISAGNCAIVKPSEIVPHCAEVIATIIRSAFDPRHVTTVLGDRVVSEQLLELPFDHIFFTGSTNVGRLIMGKAAQKLIPVTLQLGGKCPGIVEAKADIDNAAKRIAWGKFWNAGQSCNTIDHVFVHNSVRTAFIEALIRYTKNLYGHDPLHSKDYGRIVNTMHTKRLQEYLAGANILHGGTVLMEEKYISPTIVDNIPEDSPLRRDEIFGPILPCYYYDDLETVLTTIKAAPKPLALYIFTTDKSVSRKILRQIDSGTACINDLMIQATSPSLPIGGVGQSGFGDIHGFEGFQMFSSTRSVLWQSRFDLPLRFPPYNERFVIPFLKKFL